MHLSIPGLLMIIMTIKSCLLNEKSEKPTSKESEVRDSNDSSTVSSEDIFFNSKCMRLSVFDVMSRLSSEVENEVDKASSELYNSFSVDESLHNIKQYLEKNVNSSEKNILDLLKKLTDGIQSDVKLKYDSFIKNIELKMTELFKILNIDIKSDVFDLEDEKSITETTFLIVNNLDKFLLEEAKMFEESSSLFIAEIDDSLSSFNQNFDSTLNLFCEELISDIKNMDGLSDDAKKTSSDVIVKMKDTLSQKIGSLVMVAKLDIKLSLYVEDE